MLKVSLLALWTATYEVYGVRKLWKAAVRAGEDVGRDQVARLMRELGICGVRRGGKVRTTPSDEAATRPPDLVERSFAATRPNALWVTGLTYVATWARSTVSMSASSSTCSPARSSTGGRRRTCELIEGGYNTCRLHRSLDYRRPAEYDATIHQENAS